MKSSCAATQQKSLVQPAPSFRPDEVRCQRELDSCKEPLIGIEFLTEYHPAKRRSVLSYRCSLCQCTFNQSSLISHIIGSRHRIKFFEHYDLGLNGRDHRGVRVMKPADTHKYADEIERRQGRKKMKIKNCDVNDDDLEIDLSNVEMIDEWSESGNDVQHRREDVDQRMNHMRRADVDERFHRREPVVIDYGHKIRENIDVDHRRPNERFDNDAYYRDEGRSYDADHDRQQLQHYEQSYKPQDEEASRPDPVAEFHKRLQAVSDNRAAQGYEENIEQRVVSSSSGYETQPNIPPRRLEEPLSKRRPVQDEAPPAAKRSRPAEESVQLDNQKMLQSLASCMMSSDDDVQLALKVSNALAKAILEYRLRYINSYEAGEELTAQLRLLTDEADNISEQVQDGQASNVQGEKLLSLVQSMVQSEQDLETAMDVSKALTKAILDYRMKALTDDVQEAPPSQIAPAYAHSTPSSTPYAPSPSMHAAPTPPSYAPPPASTFAPSSTAAFLPSSFMPAYAFAPTPSPQPLMCMPGASMLDRPPSPPPPPPPDEEKPPLPDSPPPGVFCRKTNKNKKSFRFGL
ncbi:hypothetical protein CAPTEDRAFT_223441 [Capitella teleta]|uniref:Uncharacterized protein n=1 Tax=Capitella teleta TaxID=283909 RepID=R7V3D0_CAPTE|nr:hypothetical protein CAPTEDRAFT_223441 [Capitella teleta]|eukprot:ELU12987.1 hypothetical protein CAPTEDRAFT_223441 [Capitella teleta]